MFTILAECYSSLKQYKLRTILTGFGVAWGIFILIILIGVGNGFETGILNMFDDFAQKSLWVYAGKSSQPKENATPGEKQILFDEALLSKIKKRFGSVAHLTPLVPLGGDGYITYGNKSEPFDIKAVTDDYFKIKILNAEHGRLLNHLDNHNAKRYVVIGNRVKEVLFAHENPIGEFITISGIYFKVVGTIESGSVFSANEQNAVYMPYSAIKVCFNQGRLFSAFGVSLHENGSASAFEHDLKQYLANRLHFDENDPQALFITNLEKEAGLFEELFSGINIFLWLVGLCLLLTGIIGISNIMLVIVKERTVEIGIRKAVGAKAKSILSLVVAESIVITATFGLIGFAAGAGCLGLINWLLDSKENIVFSSAHIDLATAAACLFLLISSGTIAGILPAIKAVKITPVEALREK